MEDDNGVEPEFTGNRMLTPEERLWLYVLLDAIERWREGDRLAYQWLFNARDGEEMIGSLAWICARFGLDGDAFTGKLRETKLGLDFFGRSVSRIIGEF